MWFTRFRHCKITTNGIITVMLYIKVTTQVITTRTIIMTNAKFTVATVSNVIIGSIVITTTTTIISIITITSYCFTGLASCTLRDRQDTASIQGDFRCLPFPLTNDERRC
jgi:L-asparagine transporter-like permease